MPESRSGDPTRECNTIRDELKGTTCRGNEVQRSWVPVGTCGRAEGRYICMRAAREVRPRDRETARPIVVATVRVRGSPITSEYQCPEIWGEGGTVTRRREEASGGPVANRRI